MKRISIIFTFVCLSMVVGCAPQKEKVLLVLRSNGTSEIERLKSKEANIMKEMIEEAMKEKRGRKKAK